MPTKVYSYGCKHPRIGADLIQDQISKGHRYYNKLIELRRKQLTDAENVRREMFPDFAAAEQAVKDCDEKVESIIEEIREANAKERRKRATPEESERLKQAKVERKEAWAKRKSIRADIAGSADLQARLAGIYAEHKEATRKARAECEVYWGTYGKVEAAVEAAVKKTIGMPQFKRWDGAGQVAVQIQYENGDPAIGWQEMVIGKGKIRGLFQAEPLPTNRTGKSARPWLFSIRVGSDETRQPIWAKVMAYVHRPLPEDAKIMGISLVRRPLPCFRSSNGKYEPRYEWLVQFTVRTNEEKPRASSGTCGIDLGWRLIDGRLRVAYLVGDDGYREELLLPSSLLNRWSKSESIQGIRDRLFDTAKAKLIEFKQSREEWPEWFAEAVKSVGQWKAHGKMGRLIDQWGENRIDGDAGIFDALTAWRDQDIHLWQYGAENLLKAQRIRLHLYREFARRVAMRYGMVIVEDFDWRKLAKKPKADDNKSDAGMKEYMRIASVGKLRELLKQDGAIMVDSADTTKKCHACGSVEEFDHAKELVHTCSACALPWDQDYNAAMNLLASGAVVDETLGTAREMDSDDGKEVASSGVGYVGKWTKRKGSRSQKESQSVSV